MVTELVPAVVPVPVKVRLLIVVSVPRVVVEVGRAGGALTVKRTLAGASEGVWKASPLAPLASMPQLVLPAVLVFQSGARLPRQYSSVALLVRATLRISWDGGRGGKVQGVGPAADGERAGGEGDRPAAAEARRAGALQVDQGVVAGDQGGGPGEGGDADGGARGPDRGVAGGDDQLVGAALGRADLELERRGVGAGRPAPPRVRAVPEKSRPGPG